MLVSLGNVGGDAPHSSRGNSLALHRRHVSTAAAKFDFLKKPHKPVSDEA
jgi:hypothetical protein